MFTNVIGLLSKEEKEKLDKNFKEANSTFADDTKKI